MKKVLFFDIDGTLISDITKKIPASTSQALKQAKANGHLLFINTGRTFCRIVPELKELDFDGYLCGCGIYLTYHDEIIFEKHLSRPYMDQIVALAKKCNVEGVFEGVETVYYFNKTYRFKNLERVKVRYIEEGLGEKRYLENGDYNFDKFFVNTDAASDTARFLNFVEKEMDIIDRGNGAYECVPKGYSKATAMEMIYQKFNINRENSYAFGDSSNDIPMFEAAVHTIGMGTHSKMIEPYTEFITKAVEDDGIAHAMKHYGLI